MATGRQRATISHPKGPYHGAAFSHDRKALALLCLAAGGTQLFDLSNPDRPQHRKDMEVGGHAVVFSPHNDFLVALCSRARSTPQGPTQYADIQLVSLRTFSVFKLIHEEQDNLINSASFTPNGELLATTGTNGTLKLWDLPRGRVRVPSAQPMLHLRRVVFSPDSRVLYSGSVDPPTEVRLLPLRGMTNNLQTMWRGNTAESVRLWDTASRTQLAALALPPLLRLECLALAPDGGTLAAGCTGGCVVLWDVAERRERLRLFLAPEYREYYQGCEFINRLGPLLPSWQATVRALAFSPDGRTLATLRDDGVVQLWDPARGEEMQRLTPSPGEALCLAFAPDATLAVGRGTQVELWDSRSGQLRQTLVGHSNTVSCLAFSPDSKLLASGAKDYSVRLWEPAGGRRESVLVGHEGQVASLAFSPDGRVLASGGSDHTVRLWHVATAQELLTFRGRFRGVHGVAFAPNGKMLATCSDGFVCLWRAGETPADK